MAIAGDRRSCACCGGWSPFVSLLSIAAAAPGRRQAFGHHRRLSDDPLSGAHRARRRDDDDRSVAAQFQPSAAAAGPRGARGRPMAGRRRFSAAASRSNRRSWRPMPKKNCSCGWSRRPGTGPGEYRFLVEAKGEGSDLKLPITRHDRRRSSRPSSSSPPTSPRCAAPPPPRSSSRSPWRTTAGATPRSISAPMRRRISR